MLIEYVGLFQQGDPTIEARKALFVEQRKLLLERMTEMQRTLERLDYKISVYDQTVVDKENELKINKQ